MATWILEMTFKPPTPTYCLLVITYDALIIPSEPRIFHRRYLSCLYWRLPWSIPTYTVSRLPGMCKFYLLFLKNSWVTLFRPDSIRSSFFLLCFLPQLSLIPVISTFFRGLNGSVLSVFLILRSVICFKENDDEVNGRSSSISFWVSQANCSTNVFNWYSFTRAASFSWIHQAYWGVNTSFFSLWSFSCCIFDLVLISAYFSICLTVILVCFHHFVFDLTMIEDLIAGKLSSWNT